MRNHLSHLLLGVFMGLVLPFSATAGPVQQLEINKVFELPVVPGISPGPNHQETVSGPYFYGPTDFDVSKEAGFFVVDTESPSKAILRVDWQGRVLERFAAKNAQGIPSAPALLSCVGLKVFAYYRQEHRLRVWQVGKTSPIINFPLRLPSWAQPNREDSSYVMRIWGTYSGQCFVLVSVRNQSATSLPYLFRVAANGQGKRVGTKEFDGLIVAPSASLYQLATVEGKPGDGGGKRLWQLTVQRSGDKKVRQISLLTPSSSMGGFWLVGIDKGGNSYLRKSRFREEGDGVYQGLSPFLLKVSPTGQNIILGSKPGQQRWWTTKRERVSASGDIFFIYPLNPNAPKGEKVSFALGKYE